MRFQTQIRSKQLLLAAAILCFAIALFQAVLSFSSSLSRFFGAGELAANPLLLLVAGLAVTILFALSGLLPDQSALHGLLERIRDLNLTLISLNTDAPSTQDSDTEE